MYTPQNIQRNILNPVNLTETSCKVLCKAVNVILLKQYDEYQTKFQEIQAYTVGQANA
jgi:hypothetical protein